MQPYVKQMHVFVRTGVWFVNIPSEYGQEYEYTAAQKEGFKNDPAALVAHAKQIEDGLGGFFPLMFKGSTAQAQARKQIAESSPHGEAELHLAGEFSANGDRSPHLAIGKIGPRWLKASGIDVETVLEYGAEASVRRWRQEMQDSEQDVRVEIEGESGRV
ncbi:hypothetical protein LX32DRAFT_649015 [Colletotrichum zoysiae]|uniref:Uncharacterized protein n=1 Tax=Colletotrichum zoysiae TaxID=1216348 RepID=A0AAD9M8I7_9PEZI|nr:hypothetical protein LX32DRAFT_649015 [Colletotrichum zoysiae]